MNSLCFISVHNNQEGATKEEIERLPKYKFNRTGDVEKVNGDLQESTGGMMTKCDTDAPTERFLRSEDSVSFSITVLQILHDSFIKLLHYGN